MTISKSLLLKCLGGVAACFGTASLAVVGSEKINSGNDSSESETELNKLLKKVGLSNCTVSGGTECTIGAKFNVKQGDNKEENKTKDNTSSGKIKVYSDDTYSNKFKFLIEEGDIALTGGNGTPSITKLEQFETYEIKEEDGSWYFSRKKTSAENIRETLGLPSDCTLGDTPSCSDKEITTTAITSMKFDGVTTGNPSADGAIILTVTKENTNTDKYPLGYKFTFKAKDSTSSVTLTLGSKTVTLGTNEEVEFKIKKSGSSLSLEESGSLSIYLEKVGLSGCTTSNSAECTIGSGGLKVEQGTTKEEGKTKQTGSSGKIKVYKDTSTTNDYSKGYKFEIEEGDITLTGGTGTISKLEQFETYEIKEENGNSWYFSRKKKAGENIKDKLGLPSTCTLGENTSCSDVEITTANIGTMKFDGVNTGSPTITGSAKLTVTKLSTSDSDYPLGYKFSFRAKDSTTTTLSLGDKSITLNTSQDKEFRIKKPDTGNNITLEEAWTKEILLEKVGLNCTDSNECTVKSSGTINIKQDNDKLEEKTLSTSDQGKIKLYTGDQASGYNHGFKFVIEEKDISITSESDKKLEQFETYEIKDEGEGANKKWYFSRKKKASEEIKTALGLPDSDCTLPSSESESSTCCDLDDTKLKNIKFDGKGDDQPSIESNGSATLTITKVSDTTTFPLGYKFAFEPTETVTISSTSSIKIMKKTNTEFKIKKGESGNTITLEKAWSAKSLGAKVGLSCPEPSSGGDKKCDFTPDKINVDNGSSESKITNGKLSESSSGKKMTYEEDQEGYNQGLKFYLEENEDISLTNGSGGGDTSGDKKINKKSGDTGTETYYEIKETSGTWYLTKKETSNGGGS